MRFLFDFSILRMCNGYACVRRCTYQVLCKIMHGKITIKWYVILDNSMRWICFLFFVYLLDLRDENLNLNSSAELRTETIDNIEQVINICSILCLWMQILKTTTLDLNNKSPLKNLEMNWISFSQAVSLLKIQILSKKWFFHSSVT